MATLREKNVAYDIDYIDLQDKPDWFVAMSPLGKVPTLEVTQDDGDKVVLFESVVINEYLDEVTEGRMLPEDPLGRARARAWIEFSNTLLNDVFKLTSKSDEAELSEVVSKMNERLDRLENELGDGPFFLGAEMSLVDAAFLPALQRLFWANEIHPPIGSFETRPKLKRWWDALAAKDSVKNSAIPELEAKFRKMIGRDRGGYQSIVGANA